MFSKKSADHKQIKELEQKLESMQKLILSQQQEFREVTKKQEEEIKGLKNSNPQTRVQHDLVKELQGNLKLLKNEVEKFRNATKDMKVPASSVQTPEKSSRNKYLDKIFPRLTVELPRNDFEGVKEHLNLIIDSKLNPQTADKIILYMESLPPEAVLESYRYLFAKIASQKQVEDFVTPRAVEALQKYPKAYKDLKSIVPEVVAMLFSPGKKWINPVLFQKHLVVSSKDVRTDDNYLWSENRKVMTFEPVDNGKYVIISRVDEDSSSLAIGSKEEALHKYAHKIGVKYDSLKELGHSFQWLVALVQVKGTGPALKFINRRTHRALDSDSQGLVYVHDSNDGFYQHWKLYEQRKGRHFIFV